MRLTLLLAFQHSYLCQNNWELINSPTTENLNAVYFTDSLYGWAAGFGGTILQTTNGGSDWYFQDPQTTNSIEDIFFINRDLGWAVYWEIFNPPYGTYVLKTTNGGSNWIRSILPQENIYSKCIYFIDSLYGWMGGKVYPILQTTDGGLTWTESQIDSSTYSLFPVYDIQFYDSKYGYASGGSVDCCGVLWWTTDGGDNWSVIDTPFVAPEPIYQIYTRDSITVLGVGGDFEPLGFGVGKIISSNGGGNWLFNYIGIGGVAWDIDFRTDNEAWAPLGGEQKLIYSFDDGNNWSSVPSPGNSMILQITFPDSLHGFGVGLEGAIIKYKPDISSFTEEKNMLISDHILLQNYPNPFNPATKIRFKILETGFVTLKIYDVLGNEVATLVNEEKPVGEYEVEFSIENLSKGVSTNGTYVSGIYFYQLKIGSLIETRKMLLLK